MALIVEDGSCPKGANSYADVAAADAYLANRKTEGWPQSADDQAGKEAALIKAADYLNGLSWHGGRMPWPDGSGGRVMAWPRRAVIDADGYPVPINAVPQAVVDANCWLAGLVYSGVDLQPVLERGGRVQSESVGSLSTSYFDDAASRDIYSVLADLLGGLADGFGDYSGTGTQKKTGVIPLVLG